MIITKNGIAIRQKADAVSIIGRNTQGVKLIRLDENDDIADVARITAPNESEAEDQSETNESANPDRDGEE